LHIPTLFYLGIVNNATLGLRELVSMIFPGTMYYNIQ